MAKLISNLNPLDAKAAYRELRCSRCLRVQLVSERMALLIQKLNSSAPFVCSRCAVDGKGALSGSRNA